MSNQHHQAQVTLSSLPLKCDGGGSNFFLIVRCVEVAYLSPLHIYTNPISFIFVLMLPCCDVTECMVVWLNTGIYMSYFRGLYKQTTLVLVVIPALPAPIGTSLRIAFLPTFIVINKVVFCWFLRHTNRKCINTKLKRTSHPFFEREVVYR